MSFVPSFRILTVWESMRDSIVAPRTRWFVRLVVFLCAIYVFLAAIETFGSAMKLLGRDTADGLFSAMQRQQRLEMELEEL